MTIADMLVSALSLPPLAKEPVPVPAHTYCAITGAPIEAGYPVMDAISDSTGEYMDAFHGQPTGYLSEPAARAIAGDWNLGQIAIIGKTVYRPLISGAGMPAAGEEKAKTRVTAWSAWESANKGAPRPLWRDVVRQAWPGQRGQSCLILFTTDAKKRMWPRARVGVLGESTAVLVHDSKHNTAAIASVHWPHLLRMLDTIEAAYTAGYSKQSIKEGLYSDLKTTQRAGWKRAAAWENALRDMRPYAAQFVFALLIAQKDPARFPELTEEVRPARAAAKRSPAPVTISDSELGGLFT